MQNLDRKGGNMYSSVLSTAISGVEGVAVLVEADVSNGLPMFSMVGFLSSRVREAQDRVWTALRNTGLSFPPKTDHGKSFSGRYTEGRHQI